MLNRDTVRQLELPRRIDGALFSLSYSVRPDPLGAVAATWKYLKPGKSLFIMDGQLARGVFGRLSRLRVTWLERENNPGETRSGNRGRTRMNSTPKRKWKS